MFVTITGADDARLAPYRLVADPAALRSAGLFVAEGRLVLQPFLSSAYEAHSVLVSEAAVEPLRPLLASRPGLEVFVAPAAIISAIGGHDFHRGCLALGQRAAREQTLPAPRDGKPLLLLERVSNPDNIGGIFRAALALGAGTIVLGPGCGDPLYRKAIRTSMGATLHVPWIEAEDWKAQRDRVRDAGYTLVALTPAEDAVPLEQAVARAVTPIAFILGSEGFGLAGETMAMAAMRARIPMIDGVDSLNVVTAAAIALYEAARKIR